MDLVAPDSLPIRARVDDSGRLVEADAPLAALQEQAGGRIGATLAIPQLAALARTARLLGVPISRSVIAGGTDLDVDLWVRADPNGKGVALTIESWTQRPPAAARFPRAGAGDLADTVHAADEWTVDSALRLTRIGSALAARVGADVDWAIGQPLTRLLRLIEEEDGTVPLMAALAQRTAFTRQRATPRDADQPLLFMRGEPMLLADGSIAGFRGVAVTEDEESARQQQEPAPTLDIPLDTALREPLDQIIDAADRIAGRTEGPLRRDYAGYATDIATAARHLLDVIQGMEGTPALAVGPIDLAALIDETVAMLQADATARGVRIAVASIASPLPASGDPRAVIQILINLIANAVRHSPAGAEVSIAAADGEGPSVLVQDQGPGIARADQERIFERFEQAGSTPGGSGLGLTIARRLARAMGGDITVDSEPGSGARFTLSLSR